MMTPCLALIIVLSATQAAPGEFDRDELKPTDAIVKGYVKSLNYKILDELGLNVEIIARLRVKRVLKGKIAARSITVRYIAHTDLPHRTPITFHLRRSSNGIYLVCSKGGRGYRCD